MNIDKAARAIVEAHAGDLYCGPSGGFYLCSKFTFYNCFYDKPLERPPSWLVLRPCWLCLLTVPYPALVKRIMPPFQGGHGAQPKLIRSRASQDRSLLGTFWMASFGWPNCESRAKRIEPNRYYSRSSGSDPFRERSRRSQE